LPEGAEWLTADPHLTIWSCAPRRRADVAAAQSSTGLHLPKGKALDRLTGHPGDHLEVLVQMQDGQPR
jgi:hypothetical protein